MNAGVRGLVRSEEGATTLIVAVVIVVLLAFSAIVIDAGAVFSQRRQMQTAADSAALAGVQELPGDPAAALYVADAYALANIADADDRTFRVESTHAANDTIVADLRQSAMGLFFARVMGHESAPVAASATAVVSSPSTFARGVMPFGMMAKDPDATGAFGYDFNALEVLKQPPPNSGGSPGNFQFVALTDPPGGKASNANQPGGIKYDIEHGGVANPVYIGAEYHPEPGINGATTRNALNELIGSDTRTFDDIVEVHPDGTATINDYSAPRLIVVPILIAPGADNPYHWESVPGGSSGWVRVIGFAYFYIEGVGGTGNQAEVTGRFVRPVNPQDDVMEWGPIDPFGAIGYRLVR